MSRCTPPCIPHRLLAVALVVTATHAQAAPATFRDSKIAPGVHVVSMLDPLGLANHSNAVFIVSDRDVILVDTQFTLERTREVLDLVRRSAGVPVGVLVNTHWHDDHTFGNQVIRDAFPDVDIVAQEATARDMAGIGVTNREQQVAGGPDALAMFRDCVANQRAVDGSDMGADERAAYESTIAIVEQYLGDMPGFRLTLPTRTFEDRLVLERGGRTIEIRHLGPAVTDGDAVVWLPAERVLIAGDIVDDPLPFAYRCHVSGWIDALETIRALNPRIIVPGHGPVLQGTDRVDRLHALLTSIRGQTRTAVARGESVEQARAGVDVKSLRAPIVGDNKMLAFLFDGFFVGQVVQSAYNEASAK